MNTSPHRYWNNLLGTPSELVGCYPMGGGGLLEAPYRHFWELKHLRKKVAFSKQMNVLEVGCGNGRWALSLAPLVNHYTGVDFGGVGLAIAESRLKERHISNVTLSNSSILDFASSDVFEVVYFSGVTQYLEDDEIRLALHKLKSNVNADTILIDRSTVNYRAREISTHGNYMSIYRTPEEISQIFQEAGYIEFYQRRSYRFLRGGQCLTSGRKASPIRMLSILTAPASHYGLLAWSWLADLVNPIPFEGGDRSHDFLLFRRN